jgi:biopolymer transport protein TolQ
MLMQSSEVGLLSVLKETGTISRIVLAILLIVSVWSWGIILSKALLLRKVRTESDTFWRMFRRGHSLTEVSTACEALHFTPLVPVFNSGAPLAAQKSPNTKALQRAMQRSASSELTGLERHLTFLATTAAAAPFVGLLGTVIGVLKSFMGLAVAETASFKAVAPGIADALLATALGLFAAIPAVIAYNHFVQHLRQIGGQLDELQSELLGIAEGDG